MSTAITDEEKVKIAKWIAENFEVNTERLEVKIPTDVPGEAVWIPLQKVIDTLKDKLVQAFRNNEDPWIYIANVQMPLPPTDGLVPCDKCGDGTIKILRTTPPEHHFNQYIKRLASSKLKVGFMDKVVGWLT